MTDSSLSRAAILECLLAGVQLQFTRVLPHIQQVSAKPVRVIAIER